MPSNTVVVQGESPTNIEIVDEDVTVSVPGDTLIEIAQPIDEVTTVQIAEAGIQGATGPVGVSNFQTVHTYAIGGPLTATTSDPMPPFFFYKVAAQTAVLKKVAFKTFSGTATMVLKQNGTQIQPSTINVTATRATMTFDVALADGDVLLPEITAVASSPQDLTFTMIIEHNVS